MIAVVGSYNQDLVWRTPQFPRPGETRVGQFSQGPGGKGFNQAMAAHRLGMKTLFIAARGADALGEGAAHEAETQGLECSWQICGASATGNAAIWLDAHGQNQILVDLAANRLLSAEHIDTQMARLSKASVVLVQNEANPLASAQALTLGKKHGALAIVNPAPAPSESTGLLQLADILTPNESEFSALLQLSGQAISADAVATLPAQQLHALAQTLPCATVIITLGGRGMVLSGAEGFHEIQPPAVSVRDTTGAGDCFNGALAAELAKGAPLQDACGYAVLAAACKVERAGAALAMPTRADISARFG